MTSTEKQSTLTIVERANNNALLAESMDVRNNKNFSYESNMEDSKGVQFSNNKTSFLSKAFELFKSEEFKNNPLLLRILSGTNKVVGEVNNMMRRAIFGENIEEYVAGDILMGYTNWKVDYKTKRTCT